MDTQSNEYLNLTPETPLEEVYKILLPELLGYGSHILKTGRFQSTSDLYGYAHDFITLQWPTVIKSYRPEKAMLSNYLFICFRNFVMQEINRLKKMCYIKQELAEKLGPPDLHDSDYQDKHDRNRLDIALAKLTREKRNFIIEHFSSKRPSIRRTAKTHNINRHSARKNLAKIATELLFSFDKPQNCPQACWTVSQLILVEQRSIASISKKLGIREKQVRDYHKQTLAIVENLFK